VSLSSLYRQVWSIRASYRSLPPFVVIAMPSNSIEIYYEPSGCNCDGTSYSRDSINAAAAKALELASAGKTLGVFIGKYVL